MFSSSTSVKGAPFATFALATLLGAFAVAVDFVGVFTVISFFPWI
jgi:hypothetical protein